MVSKDIFQYQVLQWTFFKQVATAQSAEIHRSRFGSVRDDDGDNKTHCVGIQIEQSSQRAAIGRFAKSWYASASPENKVIIFVTLN